MHCDQSVHLVRNCPYNAPVIVFFLINLMSLKKVVVSVCETIIFLKKENQISLWNDDSIHDGTQKLQANFCFVNNYNTIYKNTHIQWWKSHCV